MSSSLPLPYDPNPVPTNLEDVPRFLFEELERIAAALRSEPVAFAVEGADTVTIGTTAVWSRIFDNGNTPSWQLPGGVYDNTTGIWTCPQSGLYSISVDMTVDPFGAGNKNYYAGLRLTRDRGGVLTTREAYDGGADDVQLSVTLSGLIPLQQGDDVYVDATAVHEQFTGTSDITTGWQILMESAA